MRRLYWLVLVAFPIFVFVMYASVYTSLQRRNTPINDVGLERPELVKVANTLENCLNGRARAVDHPADLVVDNGWTGDVVVQADNRMPDFGNVSAWGRKGHVEASLLFNSIMSERVGAKYVLVRVPQSCITPQKEVVIRFWCKVPAMRLTAKLFPNARSVLFVDSDAYRSASLDTLGKDLWSNRYEFHESSPLYVGRSIGMQWEVLNQKMGLYKEPMNSGAILFHPSSKRVKETLDWWWFNTTRPDYVSLVDACKSRIVVRLNFHPRCPVRNNLKRTGRVNMFQRVRLLLYPYLHPLTRARPVGQLFAPRPTLVREPIDLESRGLKFRLVRSMQLPRIQVEFRVGHLRDVAEIERVVRAFQQPDSPLTEGMEQLFGCPIMETKSWLLRPSSMLQQWPGDQERLQSIRERFPEHVEVRTELATYDTSSLRLNNSLVFHSCKRVMRGQQLALSYLKQQRNGTTQWTLKDYVDRLKAIETVCMSPNSTSEF